jgi:hypothetical protein
VGVEGGAEELWEGRNGPEGGSGVGDGPGALVDGAECDDCAGIEDERMA